MNSNVIDNYCKLKLTLFLIPIFFLAAIVLWLYSQNALSINEYVEKQKDVFFFINYNLGQYPSLQHNLTQFGDAVVFLSFLGIFTLFAPKIWEALVAGSLVSLIFCSLLKKIFAVPRPAAMINNDCFIIIGKKLIGTNSVPSGHSVTVFTVLTVLMFAFMPKKIAYKIVCFFSVLTFGFIVAFSRVGVGAHYPIDVIAGSIIGHICGLIGIFISTKYTIFGWVGNRKYYPIIMLFLLVIGITLIVKIINDNLIVYYLAFSCLVYSFYKIICIYAKK